MDAPIQYARTADGVGTALWTLGTGEPLVYMAGSPWCHIELLQLPACVEWYERLAENRMLVRYDVRGTGFSDREAFDHFDGLPKVIIPDNLKSAIVRAAFGVDDKPLVNRTYRELARFYGFQIDPTPPRSPEKKGKVESNVRYVKNNFLRTWETVDIKEDRRQLHRWVMEIAGRRKHGTTGRLPLELFEEEESRAGLFRPLHHSPPNALTVSRGQSGPDL